MGDSTYYLIAYVSMLSVFFPISIGLWKLKIFDNAIKLVLLWLVLSGLFDLACYMIVFGYILPSREGNNMIAINFFPVIQLIIIPLIYQRFFTSSINQILRIITIGALLFILWLYFLQNGYNEPLGLIYGTGQFVCIIYLLIYFSLFLIEKIEIDYSYNHESLLWISSGILLFFVGSFIVVAGIERIEKFNNIFRSYLFQLIPRIIMNIAIFIGFYVYKRNPRDE